MLTLPPLSAKIMSVGATPYAWLESELPAKKEVDPFATHITRVLVTANSGQSIFRGGQLVRQDEYRPQK